jgi:hypothetical protein
LRKDTFLTSFLVGLGSTALEILISLIFKYTKLIQTPLYLFVGKLTIGEIPAKPWILVIIGILGHLLTGIIFAFILILILQKWGRDYLYLKGLGYGGFLWLIHELIIPNIITTNITLRITASSQLWHFLDGLIWGISAAIIYKYLQERKVLG